MKKTLPPLYIDTADFANFCEEWRHLAECRGVGTGYLASRAKQRHLVNDDYSAGFSITLRGMKYSCLSGMYKNLWKVSSIACLRHQRDIAKLKEIDSFFGLTALSILPVRVADTAPIKEYRPEFKNIANDLCLQYMMPALNEVARRYESAKPRVSG